jgi:Sigma-54 interaction domain
MIVMNAPDLRLSDMPLLQSLTVRRQRPNLWVVADDGPSEALLAHVVAVCESPIYVCRLPGALELPVWGSGTLVLHDIDRLTIRQQINLMDWLRQARGRVQVVSIARGSMLDLIANGRFLEGLYYRLNTLSVRASGGPEALPLA